MKNEIISIKNAERNQATKAASAPELLEINQHLNSEIAERKRADEALRASEKKSHAWLEHSPVCTKVVDLDFNLQYMSASGLKALKIDDITEFYGKPYPFDFYPDSFRNIMIKNLEKVRETGEIITQEASVVDIEGNELWYHSTLVPVTDDEGQIDYIMVVSIDTTERKQAEEKLQKAHTELEQRVRDRTSELVETNQKLNKEIEDHENLAKFPSENPNPVLRITKEGKVLYTNEAGNILLAKWNSGVEKTIPQKWCDLLTDAFESDKTQEEEEEVNNRIFAISIAPVKEAGYANLYARDITEHKKAENQVLGYQKQLQQMGSKISMVEEQQRREIATILHDNIGQDLALSMLKLDTLKKSVSSKDIAAELNEIHNAIEKAIQDTRTLSFDLSSPILYRFGFVRAIEQWISEQVRKKYGIKTRFVKGRKAKQLDEEISVVLYQATREVLINVIKHAQAKSVEVSVNQIDGEIEVIVEDDGVGFEISEIDQFISKSGGFGLFNVRERLNYIGGDVRIESKPENGTRVVLAIPTKAEKK